jgi:hypothetical protein
MYITIDIMYITSYIRVERQQMGTVGKRAHKHFQLDAAKIRRAQKVFKAKTETEAIDRALDFAIDEHEKDRIVAEANERFISSGVEIKDLYRKLGD